jgi:hypothetical protein
MITAAFLILLAAYLGCGLVFAIPFALVGVKRIDPHAAHGSWGFRLLVIPGTMAFWPLLLRRWLGGTHEPPEECTPHRPCSHQDGSADDTHRSTLSPRLSL